MILLVLIAASSLCVLTLEVLKRRFSVSVSVTRKLAHAGTALVAVLAPLYVGKTEIILTSLIFSIVFLVGRHFRLFSSIHETSRTTYGEVFLPLGVACSAFFFLPQDMLAFQFGVTVMAVSDALAGLLGERWGKHSLVFFNHKKSIEGSAAFFLSAFLITVFFFPGAGYALILIPAALTGLEFVSVYGTDNLLLPVIGGILVLLV